MDNKHVGFLVLSIAALMVVVILIFNMAFKDIISASCGFVGHGDSCPMYDTVSRQTYISLAIVGVLTAFGLFLIFSRPEERVIVRKFKEKKKRLNLEGLSQKEKEAVKAIEQENGTVFQADLMEKLGIGKVGITRLLDKLEAKQIIERKRRGMNNIVVLRA